MTKLFNFVLLSIALLTAGVAQAKDEQKMTTPAKPAASARRTPGFVAAAGKHYAVGC